MAEVAGPPLTWCPAFAKVQPLLRVPGGPRAGHREGGAKPPRPRHCNRGRNPQEPLAWRAPGWEGVGSRTIRKPGDLPGRPHQQPVFEGGLGMPTILQVFQGPGQSPRRTTVLTARSRTSRRFCFAQRADESWVLLGFLSWVWRLAGKVLGKVKMHCVPSALADAPARSLPVLRDGQEDAARIQFEKPRGMRQLTYCRGTSCKVEIHYSVC